ncbi:MAG: hypothetical protein ACFE8B_10855 [Candidatus Hermodarchaeota archaeon]
MPFLTPSIEDLGDYKNYVRFWQRIEPQSRSNDITRSLQAQIRDPAWLLTRQWQTGEFTAEDGGSPIYTSLITTTSKITRYSFPGMQGEYHRVPMNVPLEMLIEREQVKQYDGNYGWRFRIQAGQQFVRELKYQELPDDAFNEFLGIFRTAQYAGINHNILEDPNLDKQTRDFLLPIVGLSNTDDGCRSLDGSFFLENEEAQIIQALSEAEYKTPENLQLVTNAIDSLKSWKEHLYSQPDDEPNHTWQTRRMEYEFCVSAPVVENGQKEQRVLVSREYDGSGLDWFDFSLMSVGTSHLGDHTNVIEGEEGLPQSTQEPIKSIPTVLSFYGCPNHRWWRFEDAKTDFGALSLDKVDLGKLLVMEFALIHGNDWFVIPLDMEIGNLKRIDSLIVTNVFGEETSINPARSSGNAVGSNVWDMFSISIESDRSAREVNPCSSVHTDSFFFIPPTLGDKDENYQVEEVRFLRDEIANMVWGVEYTTRNKLGYPISGYEAYRECLDRERLHGFKEAVTELTDPIITIAEQSRTLMLEELTRIASQHGIELPDNPTVTQILGIARELAETETSGAEELIQMIESSDLGKLWNSTELALKAVEDMYWSLTPESIISFATEVFKNTIEFPIPDEVELAVKYLIEDTIDTTKNYIERLRLKELIKDIGPSLSYSLASVVPENWIPYIAVRQQENGRAVSLFQARMLRNDPIAPLERILPKTTLLTSTPIVNEETVSRAGIRLNYGFQRTRWVDGSTHLWIGRSVSSGRGEGSSGLKFDYLK